MENRDAIVRTLRENKNEVVVMGKLVQKALGRSIEALVKRDQRLGHQVIADDSMINEKRFEIENRIMELMAFPQPDAIDRRTIVAILNIIIELERIGDYAAGIAKIVVMIGDEPPLKPLIDIPRMCEITVEMLQNSLESFVENDNNKALKVISMDEVVDGLYDQIFRELLTFMMTDPRTITRATRLVWVAHNLERAADRATNICERVVYTITGSMEELGASKY